MPIRDLIVLVIVFASVPFCFLRPWIGILVFSWIGYMNPHRYTWGMAYDFPVAQVVAMATLAGFIFTKEKDRFYMEKEIILIILLWIIFTGTTFYAFYPHLAWPMWQKTSKVLLMCLVSLPLFIDKRKLRYLLLTIAFSLGFLGLKGGIFSIIHAGAYNVRGPEGSFISGEGDFALALNMTLPLLFYLARDEENKKLKIILNSMFILSIISVIFTYRRGGFLGLAVVIFILLLRSNKKIVTASIFSLALVVVPYFIPEKWFARMETIKTYHEDRSAIGRINAWKTALNVAEDRPLVGAGFDGLTGDTIDIYSPDPAVTAADVHSIYFEVLGEHGFIAFGLFILLLLSAMLNLQKLRKTFKNNPSSKWISNYAEMLQVSLIAYMVGGAFLGRAYFDLFYHLIVIGVILKVFARRELFQTTKSEITNGTSKTD
jgi:probable O-glycosylation ligase (exosortase A-associated)